MSQSQVIDEPSAAALDVFRSRRSVRSYDPSHVIARKELEEILELATRAPSSSNMQHWRFLVIDTPELKQQLVPIANNQQQVAEASAVIAVLGDTEGWRQAETIYGNSAKAGYMPEDVARSFIKRTTDIYSSLPPQTSREVAIVDASLAAMQLMLVAKAKGYDTVPMGGYDKAKFMEAYGIPDRFVPVMLLPIGKAAKPGHPTVRLPLDEVVFWNRVS